MYYINFSDPNNQRLNKNNTNKIQIVEWKQSYPHSIVILYILHLPTDQLANQLTDQPTNYRLNVPSYYYNIISQYLYYIIYILYISVLCMCTIVFASIFLLWQILFVCFFSMSLFIFCLCFYVLIYLFLFLFSYVIT